MLVIYDVLNANAFVSNSVDAIGFVATDLQATPMVAIDKSTPANDPSGTFLWERWNGDEPTGRFEWSVSPAPLEIRKILEARPADLAAAIRFSGSC